MSNFNWSTKIHHRPPNWVLIPQVRSRICTIEESHTRIKRPSSTSKFSILVHFTSTHEFNYCNSCNHHKIPFLIIITSKKFKSQFKVNFFIQFQSEFISEFMKSKRLHSTSLFSFPFFLSNKCVFITRVLIQNNEKISSTL